MYEYFGSYLHSISFELGVVGLKQDFKHYFQCKPGAL